MTYDPLKTRTKYIHINSKHRHESEHDEARMKVHMHTPLKNVHSVAVKKFSMANGFHNISSRANDFHWIEVYIPQGASPGDAPHVRFFNVTITPGYYTTVELCTALNTAIAALNHKVENDANETTSLITFSQSLTNYTVQISLVNPGSGSQGQKYFAPVERNNALWSVLGFTFDQIVNTNKRKATEQLDDDEQIIYDTKAEVQASQLGAEFQLMGTTASPAIIQGQFPSTFESPSGIYITSDALTSGSTYETSISQENLNVIAKPVNIMEWIQFDTDRYSYVHYENQTPHYHYLNNTNLVDFEIELRSADGHILKYNECGAFNIVLALQTIDHDEVSAEFINAYNDEGYKLAHTKDKL